MKGLVATLFSSLSSVIVSIILNQFSNVQSQKWWWSLLFFTVIGVSLKFIYNQKTDSKTFAEILLGSIVGKLLLMMLAVFVYSLVDKKGLFSFSMHFISHYILFTVFEIRYLLRLIKSKTS